MRSIVLIAHNLRSSHNVGSLLRTAEGLGVEAVWLTGYTPYPDQGKLDKRLPHLATKVDKQIHKTALGAEKHVTWHHSPDARLIIGELKSFGYQIIAVEQAQNSIKLPDFEPGERLVLILGREVEGIEPDILKTCDGIVEIPMAGQKESFNVVQAAAMALYHCRFFKS